MLRLAGLLWADGSWNAGQHAFLLREQLSPAAVAALLGCLVQRKGGDAFPPAALVAGWVEWGVAQLPFTWRVEGYSQLPRRVLSAEFGALGERWRLQPYPRGHSEAESNQLSVFLRM